MQDVVSPPPNKVEHTGLTLLAVRRGDGWAWAMSLQSPGWPERGLASDDASPITLRLMTRALNTAFGQITEHGTALPP